ncbi:MAG: peptidylprolyl isomerase [Gemmatimonadaceae bacterium]
MPRLLLVTAALALPASSAFAQWKALASGTTASLRGLSVVDAQTVWASGSRGTVIHSSDGGETWRVDTVPGAARLDLRAIHGRSRSVAHVAATAGRIWRTTDGGRTWTLRYQATDTSVFLDAIDFWDDRNGVALGDPMDGRVLILTTTDGGETWRETPVDQRPVAREGEAFFAASGSSMIASGSGDLWLGSGGLTSRLFHSSDRGKTWQVFGSAHPQGKASGGTFAIAVTLDRVHTVGGDYAQPDSTRMIAGSYPLINGKPGPVRSSVKGPPDFAQAWRRPARDPESFSLRWAPTAATSPATGVSRGRPLTPPAFTPCAHRAMEPSSQAAAKDALRCIMPRLADKKGIGDSGFGSGQPPATISRHSPLPHSPIPIPNPHSPSSRMLRVLASIVILATVAGCESREVSETGLPRDPTSQERAPNVFRVRFETSKGPFVVEVHRPWAPLGADRFHQLVKSGFFDNTRFFRVMTSFMAQFGAHGDPAVNAAWEKLPIPDDSVRQSNKRGFISFASAGPDTRTTQVFINLVDNTNLDGMGFAPFGQVVEGMAVVDSLHADYGDGPPGGFGPDQARIMSEGNAYLERAFPKLDFVRTARIVGDSTAAAPPDSTK